MAGSTYGFSEAFATSESPASLLRTQVPGPLPQIREGLVEPGIPASSLVMVMLQAEPHFESTGPLCNLGHGTHPLTAPIPASAKAESWLVLSELLFHHHCASMSVGIKQELPSVHITFPNADSESDPMLILLYISGFS